MACPAIILAKRRIINANGLVKILNSSITGMRGTGNFKAIGTSGQNISFQYSLLPKILITNIEVMAKNIVILMLPVTFAPPGNTGISPTRLQVKIKKEHRKQEGGITFIMPFTHRRLYQVVVNIHYEHLYQTHKTLWGCTFLISFLIPTSA